MRIPRVHHPELQIARNDRLQLSLAEAQHVRAVLRCGVGDAVRVFDGDGGVADGQIAEISRRDVFVEVGRITKWAFPSELKVTLAVAAPKGPRQSVLVEKCTELGVWGIWPVVFERSVVKPGSGVIEKWRRTAIESCKQCGRDWTPRIAETVDFESAASKFGEFSQVFVAHKDTAFSMLSELSASEDGVHGNILVWIGPEGGMTDNELGMLQEAGGVGVRLGAHVLRIETAAIATASILCSGRVK